jgi:hypothetical protein
MDIAICKANAVLSVDAGTISAVQRFCLVVPQNEKQPLANLHS